MTESYDVVSGRRRGDGLVARLSSGAHPGFSGRVLVVEKDLTYAQAATSLSLSSIRQQFSCPINIRVGLHGVAFLRIGEGDAGGRRRRAGPAVRRERLSLSRQRGRRADPCAPITRRRSPKAPTSCCCRRRRLKARFPFLNIEGVALAALGLSGEGWFDGYSLMQAFRRKARLARRDYRAGRGRRSRARRARG